MPEKWTGNLVGKMHNNNVTVEDMANELGYTKGYVSMILNSKRKPDGARKKMEQAFDAIISRRQTSETQ